MDASDPRAKFSELGKSATIWSSSHSNTLKTRALGLPRLLAPARDDPEITKFHTYELAFSSKDEPFRSTLYDWLISREFADELLEVSESFGVYLLFNLAEVWCVPL